MQGDAAGLLAPALAEWPYALLPGVARGLRKCAGLIAGGVRRSLPERGRGALMPVAGAVRAGVRLGGGIVQWGLGSGHWRGRIAVTAGAGGALVFLLASGGAGGVVGLAGWVAAGTWDAWPPGRAAGQPWPWWAMSWRAAPGDLLAWARVLDCLAWPLVLAWTAGLMWVGGPWRRRVLRSAGAVAIAGGAVLVPWTVVLAWGWHLDAWEPAAWGRLWRFLEGGGAVPWPMVIVAAAGPALLAVACVAAAVRPDAVWGAGVSAVEGMRVRELAAGAVRAGVQLAWWPFAVFPALLLDWLHRRQGGAQKWFAGTYHARWLAFWIVALLTLSGALDVGRMVAGAGTGTGAVLALLDPLVPGASRPLAVGPLHLPPEFRTGAPPWPMDAWLALSGAVGHWLADAVLGNLGRLLALAVTALGAIAVWSVLAVAGLQLLAWGWRLLARAAATDAAAAGQTVGADAVPGNDRPDARDAPEAAAVDEPAEPPDEPDQAAREAQERRDARATERQVREAQAAHREEEDAREEQAAAAQTLDVFPTADDRAEANELAFSQMQRELPETVPPPELEGPDDDAASAPGQAGAGAQAAVDFMGGGSGPGGPPPLEPDLPEEPAEAAPGVAGDALAAQGTAVPPVPRTWDLPDGWAWLGDPPSGGPLRLPSGELDALDDADRRELAYLDGLSENRTVVHVLPCPPEVMVGGRVTEVPWPALDRPLDDDARAALAERLRELEPPAEHVEARMTQLLRELLWLRLLPASGVTPALRYAELLVAGGADFAPLRDLPGRAVFDGAEVRTPTGEAVPGVSEGLIRALRTMQNCAAGVIDHYPGGDLPWRVGAALRPAAAP